MTEKLPRWTGKPRIFSLRRFAAEEKKDAVEVFLRCSSPVNAPTGQARTVASPAFALPNSFTGSTL